jgi:hypothetical protein
MCEDAVLVYLNIITQRLYGRTSAQPVLRLKFERWPSKWESGVLTITPPHSIKYHDFCTTIGRNGIIILNYFCYLKYQTHDDTRELSVWQNGFGIEQGGVAVMLYNFILEKSVIKNQKPGNSD